MSDWTKRDKKEKNMENEKGKLPVKILKRLSIEFTN